MVHFIFGIFRDLYVVLLIILVIEQIPGSDLLHDMTRKGVITVTVVVVVAKLAQPLMDGVAAVGPVRVPRRQKKTDGGRGALLEWASAEMQGWRPAMEDATCVVDPLPEPLSNQALFAVFDGHGGAQVSLIASREFPKVLAACAANVLRAGGPVDEGSEYHETRSQDTREAGVEGEDVAANDNTGLCDRSVRIQKSLHLAMLTMDSFLRKGGNGLVSKSSSAAEALGLVEASADKKNAFNLVGSTAIVVLVDCSSGRVAVANCGDSRAVLCRNGKAIDLSEDHKPELKGEEERIRKAGGHVAMVGPCHRIDGWGLNLSRALGDFHYKARADLPPEQQKVIAVPEIQTLELTEDDEFLVLGCDGIFELHTSQKVVNIVRQGLEAGLSLEKAVEDLVDKSCSPNLMKTRGKGGDNCSAIVVRILR